MYPSSLPSIQASPNQPIITIVINHDQNPRKQKEAAAGYNCSSRTHSQPIPPHHSSAFQNALIFDFFLPSLPQPTPALSQAPSQLCAALCPLPLNDPLGEGKLRLLLLDPQRAYVPGLPRPNDS
jgi:hypothetical protein